MLHTFLIVFQVCITYMHASLCHFQLGKRIIYNIIHTTCSSYIHTYTTYTQTYTQEMSGMMENPNNLYQHSNDNLYHHLILSYILIWYNNVQIALMIIWQQAPDHIIYSI